MFHPLHHQLSFVIELNIIINECLPNSLGIATAQEHTVKQAELRLLATAAGGDQS
jgi:hypothetical protein